MFFFVLALFTLSFIPFLLMVVFIITRKRSSKVLKKRLKDIQENSPYRKTQGNKPKNDFLFLEKEEAKGKEKDDEVEKVEKIGPDGKVQARDEGQIIGFAEPKGFWSKFIMSQKIGFIFARLNASQNKDQGFWTNLIKAQDISQGKDKGRGR